MKKSPMIKISGTENINCVHSRQLRFQPIQAYIIGDILTNRVSYNFIVISQ